jgi:hypothetical protein
MKLPGEGSFPTSQELIESLMSKATLPALDALVLVFWKELNLS